MFAFGRRALVVLSLAAAVSVFAVSCGTHEEAANVVVVGSSDDDRGEVLAQVYAGALRLAGADVRVEPRIGDRGATIAALDGGEVDVVPDLTGELLARFDATSESTDAEAVFTDLNRSLPSGLSVADYALAEDRLAVAVNETGPLAEASAVDEIESRCADASVALSGNDIGSIEVLAERYGCTFGTVNTTENVVDAIVSGSADAAVVRTVSTGPEVRDLAILTDDDGVFRAQNVVPLFRGGILTDSEIKSFSVVAGELTTADLADMIDEVRSGADSGDVATRWLGERSF